MRIGIYGGSFNPPHNMHLKMATELIRQNLVDKVIFVPTGSKYPKFGLASDMDRFEMIKLMIDGNPNLEVSDYELKESQIYTYKTLDYFKILVTLRDTDKKEDLEKIELPNRENIVYTNIKLSSLSSTEIREKVEKDDIAFLKQNLDSEVLSYIRKNNLYREDK